MCACMFVYRQYLVLRVKKNILTVSVGKCVSFALSLSLSLHLGQCYVRIFLLSSNSERTR